jgi:F-type H+-transporting ATPase subunit delta
VAQLSNRYAAAIFDLSMERGKLNENLDQAIFLRDTMSDKQIQNILTHPRISVSEKYSFFDEVFAKSISTDLLGFLRLAVSKNREEFIVPALSSFIDMANNHVRRTTALVISAVPLKAGQTDSLAALLSRKLSKQVTIEQKVDPSIIGGLYIQVDGYFIDRTIKTRLQEIKVSMSEGDGK